MRDGRVSEMRDPSPKMREPPKSLDGGQLLCTDRIHRPFDRWLVALSELHTSLGEGEERSTLLLPF